MPTTYNVFDIFWDNLQLAIVGAWPEVDAQVYQDISIERFDWVNRLDSGDLTVPWCVVVLAEESTDQWGAMPHIIIKPTIYYATSLKIAATAGEASAAQYIQRKLLALKTAMFTGDPGVGTVLSQVEFDATAENPMNASLLANKNGTLQAGSIGFQCVVLMNASTTI